MSTNELKPCPFCGGEAYEDGESLIHGIFCKSCRASITRVSGNLYGGIRQVREFLRSAWNTRAPIADHPATEAVLLTEDEEREEMESYEGLVYELSVLMMRLDGNDGDPHQFICWSVGTIPEPWGDAWHKYEPQALSVLDAIGESSARAMLELARHAQRYRWLRGIGRPANDIALAEFFGGSRLQDLDAAIDAAIAAGKENSRGG